MYFYKSHNGLETRAFKSTDSSMIEITEEEHNAELEKISLEAEAIQDISEDGAEETEA